MCTTIVLSALAILTATSLAEAAHHDGCVSDCSAKKCDFDILPSCAFGHCVCDIDIAQGDRFVQALMSNVETYVEVHYTGLESRHKRSMTHEPRNRLSKRVAATITFEESRRNKRSVQRAQKSPIFDSECSCINDTAETHQRMKWLSEADLLRLQVQVEENVFFTDWNNDIKPFHENVKLVQFSRLFPKLSIKDAVLGIGSSDVFRKVFWPFVYDFAFMNQKLALLGLTGEVVPSQIQKSAFYAALEKIQRIKIPVIEGHITYSFDDKHLVDGLIHYDAFSESIARNNSAKHLFNEAERKDIIRKTDAAFALISETMPDLYRAMQQLIGSIAFYKAADREHISGSMNSAIGIIWLDPSSTLEWTVPFYAEQIVHEYIHTALYMAEMVHGMFADHNRLHLAKVMSSIRLENRDYDKSFHACYVSMGLVTFHSRAGFWTRAKLLAETIESSIQDLEDTNQATDMLTPAGEAALIAMKQFATVIRLV